MCRICVHALRFVQRCSKQWKQLIDCITAAYMLDTLPQLHGTCNIWEQYVGHPLDGGLACRHAKCLVAQGRVA